MRYLVSGFLLLLSCALQANVPEPPSEFDLRVAETALIRKFKADPEAFVAAQARLFADKNNLEEAVADALVEEALQQFRTISGSVLTAGLSRSQIRVLNSRIVSISLKSAFTRVVSPSNQRIVLAAYRFESGRERLARQFEDAPLAASSDFVMHYEDLFSIHASKVAREIVRDRSHTLLTAIADETGIPLGETAQRLFQLDERLRQIYENGEPLSPLPYTGRTLREIAVDVENSDALSAAERDALVSELVELVELETERSKAKIDAVLDAATGEFQAFQDDLAEELDAEANDVTKQSSDGSTLLETLQFADLEQLAEEARQALEELADQDVGTVIDASSGLLDKLEPGLGTQLNTISQGLQEMQSILNQDSLTPAEIVTGLSNPAMAIFSVLSKSSSANQNAAVLNRLGDISAQIGALRERMDQRFDIVDGKLDTILETLQNNFANLEGMNETILAQISTLIEVNLDTQLIILSETDRIVTLLTAAEIEFCVRDRIEGRLPDFDTFFDCDVDLSTILDADLLAAQLPVDGTDTIENLNTGLAADQVHKLTTAIANRVADRVEGFPRPTGRIAAPETWLQAANTYADFVNKNWGFLDGLAPGVLDDSVTSFSNKGQATAAYIHDLRAALRNIPRTCTNRFVTTGEKLQCQAPLFESLQDDMVLYGAYYVNNSRQRLVEFMQRNALFSDGNTSASNFDNSWAVERSLSAARWYDPNPLIRVFGVSTLNGADDALTVREVIGLAADDPEINLVYRYGLGRFQLDYAFRGNIEVRETANCQDSNGQFSSDNRRITNDEWSVAILFYPRNQKWGPNPISLGILNFRTPDYDYCAAPSEEGAFWPETSLGSLHELVLQNAAALRPVEYREGFNIFGAIFPSGSLATVANKWDEYRVQAADDILERISVTVANGGITDNTELNDENPNYVTEDHIKSESSLYRAIIETAMGDDIDLSPAAAGFVREEIGPPLFSDYAAIVGDIQNDTLRADYLFQLDEYYAAEVLAIDNILRRISRSPLLDNVLVDMELTQGKLAALLDLADVDKSADQDGDGVSNGDEFQNGSSIFLSDTDADGVEDKAEIDNGLNPIDFRDGLSDFEPDGIINAEDNCLTVSNPDQLDTDRDGLGNACDDDDDNDGLSDIDEATEGTNPLVADSDEDGLSDGDERNVYGTDPLLADTDTDGVSDGEEIDAGTNPNDILDKPATLIWEAEVWGNGGSPALSADGFIYAGSVFNDVSAISTDGVVQWQFLIPGAITSSVLIGPGGVIYFGGEDNYFYALDREGNELWRFPDIPVEEYIGGSDFEGAAIGADGTIYAADYEGTLYALNPDGTEKWRRTLSGTIESSPAIGPDGNIYVNTGSITDRDALTYDFFSGDAFALDPAGNILWQRSTHRAAGSPAIASDGTIYIGTGSGLFAFSPDGTQQWRYSADGVIRTSPAIGADGTIYAADNYGDLYAVNPDGSLKWLFEVSGTPASGSPTVGDDGVIYYGISIGFDDGYLYAVNPDGTQLWRYRAGANVTGAPAIGDDGKLFVFGGQNLYALQTDSTGYANSNWPKFAKNSLNTASELEDNDNDGIADFTDNCVGLTSTDQTNTDGDALGDLCDDDDDNDGLTDAEEAQLGTDPLLADTDGDGLTDGDEQNVYSTDPLLADTDEDGVDDDIEIDAGTSPLASADFPATELWRFPLTVNFSNPALGSDNTLYIGTASDGLYALNFDGSLKWSLGMPVGLNSSPVVDADGTVYIGSDDDYLYAVNPDGTVKWAYNTFSPIVGSAAIGADNDVYVGTSNGVLYAVNSDGSLRWQFDTSGFIGTSPVLAEDGTIYVNGGASLGTIFALSPAGAELWSYETSNETSSPAIGGDGVVYVTASDGFLYAINPDGSLRWRVDLNASIWNSPVIGIDNTIYIGTADGLVRAVNADGSPRWSFTTGDQVLNSLAIGRDDVIYAGSYDSHIYALHPDGTQKWKFDLNDQTHTTPLIAIDGTLVTASFSALIALQTESLGLADSPWPKHGRNSFNSSSSVEDADNDGVADGQDNCPLNANSDQTDTDGDGLGDICDSDTDGDGVNDGVDNCPFDINAGQSDIDSDGAGDLCDADSDGDGVLNLEDNCPVNANAAQTDTDADFFGNACDSDDDGDGIEDTLDNCPINANADQLDTDADSLGNVCDADDDGDGISDANDAFPLNAAASQDTDRDGRPDDFNQGCDATCQQGSGLIVDDDDDNDRLTDAEELSLGTDPLLRDSDGDGWSDGEEVEEGTNPLDSNSEPELSTGLPAWLLIQAASQAQAPPP